MAETTKKPGRLVLAAALATALAMPAEGLRQLAYRDPPGILTACYGHTGTDVRVGVRYSLEQCGAWLTDDMGKALRAVDTCAPGLPEPVLAAFADATFNIGPTIACDTVKSTAARYLTRYVNTGDIDQLRAACDQLPRWDKARVAGILVSLPGLTKRRAVERDLCLKGTS
jgi:GH24 family phage-related lysozyme (muramidase)